jgi:hypothetical protein
VLLTQSVLTILDIVKNCQLQGRLMIPQPLSGTSGQHGEYTVSASQWENALMREYLHNQPEAQYSYHCEILPIMFNPLSSTRACDKPDTAGSR